MKVGKLRILWLACKSYKTVRLWKTENETIKLCHYSDLQPMWWNENLSKNNKYKIE
jgi:hypothetical protein